MDEEDKEVFQDIDEEDSDIDEEDSDIDEEDFEDEDFDDDVEDELFKENPLKAIWIKLNDISGRI